MSRVNVISTVIVFSVNRQTHSREQSKDSLEYNERGGDIELRLTKVTWIGFGQCCYIHGNCSVVIMDANQQKYSPV